MLVPKNTDYSNLLNSAQKTENYFSNLPPPQLNIPKLESIFADKKFFAEIPHPSGYLPKEDFFKFTLPDFSESFRLPEFTQIPEISPNSCLWVINRLKQKRTEQNEGEKEPEKEKRASDNETKEEEFRCDSDFNKFFEDQLKKKYDGYHSLMEDAAKNSPGYLVDQLSPEEKEKALREEWLVAHPLTGICTGLAIEFILQLESGFSDAKMLPTSNARYFERLLIPTMLNALDTFNLNNPNELNRNAHFEEVYKQMMRLISAKTHLKASLDHMHLPLDQIAHTINDTEGHRLVLLEKEGKGVASGHMLYVNTQTRTIADGAGGAIMHVPVEMDFKDFLDYYLAVCYGGTFNKCSIISVERDQNFEHVRFPSQWDKAELGAKIKFLNFTDYVAKNITSNDIKEMGKVTHNLFSQTFFPSFRFS